MIRAIKTHTHFIGVMRYYRERLVRTPPRTGARTNCVNRPRPCHEHGNSNVRTQCSNINLLHRRLRNLQIYIRCTQPFLTRNLCGRALTNRNQFTYWRSHYKGQKKNKIVISTSFVRIFIVEFSTHFLRNGNRSNWLTWNFNLTYRKFAADPIVCHHVCAAHYFTNSLDHRWYWPLLATHRVRWAWKIEFFFRSRWSNSLLQKILLYCIIA